MTFVRSRLASVMALAMLTGVSTQAIGQTSPDDAADAAVLIAANAESEIRAIDPTTGGESLVSNPSVPQSYLANADIAVNLPPLPSAQNAGSGLEQTEEPARGAAARMISNPTVQALPISSITPDIANDDPFVIKSILPIEGTIRYGQWFWDDTRAPTNGKLVVTVDLDARVVSVFRDGHEIGTAVALLGTEKHPTPLGTFPILTKEKDNVSEKYNNAPMPWTLRLTWDGIAIHGSPVQNGYASHGCIGVPDSFAEKLYEIANRGDKIVITRGKMVGLGDTILTP